MINPRHTLWFVTSLFWLSTVANAQTPDEAYWRDVEEMLITEVGARAIVPAEYRTLALDIEQLRAYFSWAPLEDVMRVQESNFTVSFPLPDGGFTRFQAVESPIMHPELGSKYPEIRTYLGHGIDDPTATTRFDITPAGFHAIIFTAGGTIYIDPYASETDRHYIAYFKRDLLITAERLQARDCQVFDEHSMEETIREIIRQGLTESSGAQLRTYRAAVAATGEYTQFHGGTVSAGMAAIVTAMNRVNGIYEREVAVRMVLVPNNDQIVYTNPATDPYTNNNGIAMLSQNQSNLDAVIGNANYDIGHVFSTGGGGVASLGVVCVNSSKARGVTGLPSPIGDPFYVDYVAHEIGHQFGANHTFNGNAGSCSGNRNASTAYEPGSGSTIMAYAGICGTQNLQSNSDDYFHGASFDEIVAFTTTSSGNNCPVITATGNSPPTVNAGVSGLTLPVGTPFTLTGSATDPNGDPLTYSWEEFDLGPAGDPNSPSGNAPIFRSFPAITSPQRTFPQWSDILNNTQTIGEILPTYTRTLTFRLTARDNRAGGGGVGKATSSFSVTSGAGPFVVTSPNTAVTWSGNSTQTVTWNVANTNVSPISASTVNILLSTNGGQTWPYVLASGTPNDGSEAVLVPNVATSAARVMVAAANHLFFDVSNVNFTIVVSQPTITVIVPNGGETWHIGTTQSIQWTSGGFSGNVKIELSRNGGTTYPEVLFASTPNDGAENWSVTGPPTSQARIRISSVSDPGINDASNANFTLVQPTVTVIAPNGGESWEVGTSQTIQWTSANVTGNVSIQLSRNGGSTFETLFANTPNDGSESWTVTGPVTANARIRVASLSFPSAADTSNADFSIVQPFITVVSPNGGEVWGVGSTRSIEWTSQDVTGNVRIELSRNGGSSYEELFGSIANTGSQEWVVSVPVSTSALVRVSSVALPSIFDVSDAPFSIVPSFHFLAHLVLRDNGGSSDTLEFGVAAGATDGIDSLFGEVELPPRPPSGAFDVRWQISGTEGLRRDIRDTLGGTRTAAVYVGLLQPGSGGYPFALRWDASELPEGSFILRDRFGGMFFSVDMRMVDSLVIAHPAHVSFEIEYRLEVTVSVSVLSGWSMLSLPVTVVDRRRELVFPTAVSSAFTFAPGGYVVHDTLRYGRGYWLKFDADQEVNVTGVVRSSDSIAVSAGWNMIGSITYDVAVANITQVPSGIVQSAYFGAMAGGGYAASDTIRAMRSYWVKVASPGKLVLPGNALSNKHVSGHYRGSGSVE